MRQRPRSDAEWAALVERRLAALERPTAARVGNWTLEETGDGSLVATNSRTGATTIISA